MRLPKLKEIRGLLSESFRLLMEKPVYSVGIAAYRTGVGIASFKNPKAARMKEGHKEIYSRIEEKLKPSDKVIWIHAASLGEFEQGRPLIEKIKRDCPEYKVLLTFFSPSGYEVRKNFAGADCVTYLPFDTPSEVKKFLYKVNPEKAFFVKYEFWRNYLEELWKRQIPTYLISGIFRDNQIFFRKYGRWYALWLKWFTKIYVQDEGSARLLESVGVENVEVAGDTRFDRVSDIKKACRSIPLLARFSRREAGESARPDNSPLVFMAGSSWPSDEAVYSDWVNKNPDLKVVIAPHEFDDNRLKTLKDTFTNGVVLLSEAEKNPELADDAQVLVIDCFGLLSSAYAYCDLAYVGGGFGAGLHNINEAATFGVPVIYGPNNKKFIEARELATLGGGLEVDGKSSFESRADRLIHDPADRLRRGKWASEYIEEKQGATEKIFNDIFRR